MKKRRPNRVKSQQTQQDPEMTLSQLTADYLESLGRKGLSEHSVTHEKDNMKSVMKQLPTGIAVVAVNAKLLETQVFDVYRAKGHSPNTSNDRLKTLRRVLDFGVKKGIITKNEAFEIEKMKEVLPQIPSFTDEQIDALLRQIDTSTFTGLRNKTLILLMLDTGIRIREAMDLTVPQVDLKDRHLRRVKGKNGKIEDIPISKPMCKLLEQYLKERDHAVADHLFVSITGECLNKRTFQVQLAEYGRLAGITNVRCSPHTLRHTFAKQWLLAGGDIVSLQRILRHSTMEMVRRYVFLWSNEIQQQHDKFSPMARRTRKGDGQYV